MFRQTVISIIMSIMVVCFAVILCIQFRLLYYYNIDRLELPPTYSLERQFIVKNYNILVDYLNPLNTDTLSEMGFDFPMSKEGEIHFEEVKAIVFWIYVLFLISVLILTVLRRHITTKSLAAAAAILTGFPLILATAIFVNSDVTFIVFHQIFFRNQYWNFNPQTDPVIYILPQEFFMQCGIFILLTSLLGALVLLILRKCKKKFHIF